MAQPNNNDHPMFSFNIDNQAFFDPRSTQVDPNAQYARWGQQNSRALGRVPTPSPPPRLAIGVPDPGNYSGQGRGRPRAPQQNSVVDPNLHPSLLSVPPHRRPHSTFDNVNNADPLYNPSYGTSGIHDEPWSSVRMRNSSTSTDHSAYAQPDVDYGPYREGTGSDIDSGAPQSISDSGYYTHQAHSVRSNEPERVDQELPSSMTFGVHNMNVAGSASSDTTEVYLLQSDQASQHSGRSTPHSKTLFKCQKCNETAKCPSDFKKHMLKHDKPHACDVPGCRRAAVGKGFTTKNDLDRHKKSVHRVGVEKDSYQCASEHCRNRGKIWPRLDNFKQHISRMHKGEDEQDLIRRSAYQETYPPSGESLSVAPLDTTLAGIGTEKQFAGNELDDPASGITLTPDQDSDRWHLGGFDPTAHGFALDVDRTSNVPDCVFSVSQQRHTAHGSSDGLRRRRQDSLSVLADVADRVGTPSRPQLSSAPQTKAEQQRQALQKFSKAIVGEIQNAPSADDVDLGNVVLRVLYGATTQSQRNSISEDSVGDHNTPAGLDMGINLTKGEALKASQAISNLIKQSSVSQSASHPRRTSKTNSPGNIQCPKCDTILSRCCDMKKHMKRHTRPYGCTYPNCFKRFGAKSDWKRHENSQHFQLEAFLCHHPLPSLTPSTSAPEPCNKIFYRAEQFQSHLTSDHKIVGQAIQKDMKEWRIGQNGQGQFWCGLCKRLVKLKEKRNAAWDERFDHIDAHFGEGRGIDEWVCVEEGRSKGELLKKMDRMNFYDGEEEGDLDGEGVSDEGSPEPLPVFGDEGEGPSRSRDTGPPAHDFFPRPVLDVQMAGLKKRQLPLDEPMPAATPKRRKRDTINRYCCACQSGPWLLHSYVDCMSCGHHLCGGCTVVGGMVGLEGGLLM